VPPSWVWLSQHSCLQQTLPTRNITCRAQSRSRWCARGVATFVHSTQRILAETARPSQKRCHIPGCNYPVRSRLANSPIAIAPVVQRQQTHIYIVFPGFAIPPVAHHRRFPGDAKGGDVPRPSCTQNTLLCYKLCCPLALDSTSCAGATSVNARAHR
jgi:hypothetical protein